MSHITILVWIPSRSHFCSKNQTSFTVTFCFFLLTSGQVLRSLQTFTSSKSEKRTIYILLTLVLLIHMNTNTNFSYNLFIPNDSVVTFYNKTFLNLFQIIFQIIIQLVSDNYLISGVKTTCSYCISLSVTTNLLPP